MFVHEHQKRIRYGETDQMGYLYYGNYALLFEIGRVEAIRSMGTTYKHLEEEMRVMMPVISMECRYIAPAKYDELIHKGVVKLFFVDMETNKRVSTPDLITDKIKHLF